MTVKDVLKNTLDFKKYFSKLPAASIELDDWLRFNAATADKVFKENLEWPKEHHPCNSVGCVGGWAKYYFSSNKKRLTNNYVTKLGFCAEKFTTPVGARFFDYKRDHSVSDREEALNRINQRIKELRVLEKNKNAYASYV